MATGAAIEFSEMTVSRDEHIKNAVLSPPGPMKRHSQVAAFVLAGGASSRMGREKGLLELAGEPLIARTARLVEPLVSEVAIVGPPDRYAGLGFGTIADQIYAGGEGTEVVRTPLVGIATALSMTKHPWNLILACDLPYLTAAWLDWLLTRAAKSSAQIVIPRTSAGLEPLAAVYRKECATPIVTALEHGVRKVTDAIAELRTKCVLESEWSELDPQGRVLKNMNAASDYEEARRYFETG